MIKDKLCVGQRYMSETEPELGLGLITEVSGKQFKIEFRQTQTLRSYGIRSAPLKRIKFDVGDEISDIGGVQHIVANRELVEGLFVYVTEHSVSISETDLADNISFNHPEEKLFNGQIDSDEMFKLRIKTLENEKWWHAKKTKGLFGARVKLLAHQLYIAAKVCERNQPRVLLADEVGLGKTIEAGLIMHKLICDQRASRVLVVVPDSLVFQWFFEMHKKFHLGFQVLNQEMEPEPGVNPFEQNERTIVSIGLLRGSVLAREMLEQCEFDILVVDEAHRYQKETAPTEYEILEMLCSNIPSVLLLSATPEQLGMQGHFERLRLLDPEKFNNYDSFKKEVGEYQGVAKSARAIIEDNLSIENTNDLKGFIDSDTFQLIQENQLTEQIKKKVLQELIDRHGTGRVFLRNTRHMMSRVYDFFPERIVHENPLTVECDFDFILAESQECLRVKLNWLKSYLIENDSKVLLICHDKKTVTYLESELKTMDDAPKVAMFHSGLSLMARDRQAAYFSEPGGAQILLCTEIGSEGRNFEFAQNLILFDLPKKPDLLEQRIGRLDRIGQKFDIHIHVPIIENTWEQRLFNIYHKGLNCFESFKSIGTPVFIHFAKEIENALSDAETNEQSLIKEVSTYTAMLEKSLEQGRDILIELNSFNSKIGHELVADIRETENERSLLEYMEEVFECFGVSSEQLSEDTYLIKPNDNMFIPHFPYLEHEGQAITYSRSEAISNEKNFFMNWDHPMVREVSNLIISESYGNMSVATRLQSKSKKSFLEVYFILETQAPGWIDLTPHFPPTLVRVLIDKDGADFSEKFSADVLNEKLTSADRPTIEKATKVPKAVIKDLMNHAKVCSEEKAEVIKRSYCEEIEVRMSEEISRLEYLCKVNPNVDEGELVLQKKRKSLMLEYAMKSSIRIEAMRLIL